MTADNHKIAIRLDDATSQNAAHRSIRLWWTGITIIIVAEMFFQAGFAGAMLSGVAFSYAAHKATAALLIATSLGAGIVALTTLRHIHNGQRLGFSLLMLAIALVLQTVIGKLSAEGANLLWIHVPLGVALVVFSAHAVMRALKLGGE